MGFSLLGMSEFPGSEMETWEILRDILGRYGAISTEIGNSA